MGKEISCKTFIIIRENTIEIKGESI